MPVPFFSLPDGLTLFPFQEADLEAWLALPRPRVLWNTNEMGLGKTVDGVCCAKACAYGRVLVVALKSTRPDWVSSFKRWWPERETPAEIDRGFARKAMSQPEHFRLQAILENPTHIVSPELLPKLVVLHEEDAAYARANPGAYRTLHPYDFIIFDEFHECRSWHSKTFQAVLKLRQMYPAADFKPMSGTPLGADPLRAWPWLKVSEPSKWGTLRKREDVPFDFKRRYGEKVESEYAFSGYSYSGVNQAALPLFQRVTAHLIRRKTVKEVGLQLPPMRFEIKQHPMDIAPEDAVADWCASAIEENPVAVFTYNHAPMEVIQHVLTERKIPFVRLYEEHTAHERELLVQDAEAHRKVILATTGLVSTGVNYLANIRYWMLAQPSENPVEIQQLAKRFTRISSKDSLPRIGYLLYREGEEFSAQKVLAKRLKMDTSIILPSADALELERILAGKSNQTLLDTLKLLGRTLAAHSADDDADDEEAA